MSERPKKFLTQYDRLSQQQLGFLLAAAVSGVAQVIGALGGLQFCHPHKS